MGAGGAGVPHNVVCDGCNLSGGGSPVWINQSTGSGARNSTLTRGASGRCVTLSDDAIGGIDSNNRCI